MINNWLCPLKKILLDVLGTLSMGIAFVVSTSVQLKLATICFNCVTPLCYGASLQSTWGISSLLYDLFIGFYNSIIGSLQIFQRSIGTSG